MLLTQTHEKCSVAGQKQRAELGPSALWQNPQDPQIGGLAIKVE